MSKKDFIAAARIISEIEDPQIRSWLAKEFATFFSTQNSRFNRAKFMEACNA